uniref:Uncharacterized protein n=1 Tax=Ixodes ricinus TaxID=34613 RepID=A0A090XEY1_IXORI
MGRMYSELLPYRFLPFHIFLSSRPLHGTALAARFSTFGIGRTHTPTLEAAAQVSRVHMSTLSYAHGAILASPLGFFPAARSERDVVSSACPQLPFSESTSVECHDRF